MKKYLLIILGLTCNQYSVYCADPSVLWQKGAAFYDQKQYDSAAACFEQVGAKSPDNPELYYNLGNSYYRTNRIALSVLNYRRALRLRPDFKDARDNLQLAEGRIANRIPESGDIFFVKWWQQATRADRATLWAVTSFIVFSIFIVIIIVSSFNRRSAMRIPPQLPGTVATLCLCFLALAYFSARNSVDHSSAVVMVGDAPLMNADLKGKPIVLLPEGTTVRIEGVHGAWLEVQLPDGRRGMLMQSLAERI